MMRISEIFKGVRKNWIGAVSLSLVLFTVLVGAHLVFWEAADRVTYQITATYHTEVTALGEVKRDTTVKTDLDRIDLSGQSAELESLVIETISATYVKGNEVLTFLSEGPDHGRKTADHVIQQIIESPFYGQYLKKAELVKWEEINRSDDVSLVLYVFFYLVVSVFLTMGGVLLKVIYRD